MHGCVGSLAYIFVGHIAVWLWPRARLPRCGLYYIYIYIYIIKYRYEVDEGKIRSIRGENLVSSRGKFCRRIEVERDLAAAFLPLPWCDRGRVLLTRRPRPKAGDRKRGEPSTGFGFRGRCCTAARPAPPERAAGRWPSSSPSPP